MDAKIVAEHAQECSLKREAMKQAGLQGPWDGEPDRLEWKHQGLDCLMVRNPALLHWCGYVGVPKGHPFYEKHYDRVDAEAHGGLTYSERCQGPVCHVADDGAAPVWWLGFDCAHSGDLVPAMKLSEMLFGPSLRASMEAIHAGDVYRDATFVKAEVNSLAEQLAAVV
jgi:hypothetical protein